MDQLISDLNNVLKSELSMNSTSSTIEQKKSNVFHIVPWWEDTQEEIGMDRDDVLMTSDKTLQNIVNGSLHLMNDDSTVKIERRIKRFVNRKRLIKNRRNHRLEDVCTDSRLLKQNDFVIPITRTNLGYQLLEKIGWTPGDGLGLNQNGIKTPIEVKFLNRRQGLGYEKKTSINHV